VFGERIKRTATLPGDDSPHATELLLRNAPIACPTCGSHTRPVDTRQGWLCNNPACTFST
jgi:hypothetical protein